MLLGPGKGKEEKRRSWTGFPSVRHGGCHGSFRALGIPDLDTRYGNDD